MFKSLRTEVSSEFMQDAHQTLGRNAIPIKYFLEFEPDLKTFRFKGRVEIDVKIDRPTTTLLLNSAELSIGDAVAESRSGIQKASVHFDARNEQVAFKFAKPIIGTVKLKMSFAGTHNDKMYGFYRSKYVAQGKECYLLSSQFEPADARKAFPCFDEPEFKAVFEVSMVVDKSLECISNMPIGRTQSLKSGKKRVRFLPTPVMSTYLLYLGVGNYDSIEGTLGKVKLRVLTTKGKKKFAALSMGYLKKFLNFYNSYFGIKFPLPKLDMLAIPDFSAGAMENWGAITYREIALLGDENTAVGNKQQIAETVAHELAHMWFGDLVTMAWWDDLWLNESFATYMSFKAMDAVMPEWDMWTHYIEDVVYSAMVADQLKATHPIAAKVSNPAEISAQFDSGISYDKGGSVLRMIEDYVGADTFKAGLHKYIREHSYGNATKYDLWEAIDSAAKKSKKFVFAEKVASYWIDTPGYPIVSVDRKGAAYSLLQNRFLISEAVQEPSGWPIPIHYLGSDGSEGQFLMSKSAKRIPGTQVRNG